MRSGSLTSTAALGSGVRGAAISRARATQAMGHAAFRSSGAHGLLCGERKLITVLFADIVGSAGLIAGKDPEDANDLLVSILQTMIDCVHRFGGTVSQVLGDGIMAMFGVPFAQEQHALRACLAADLMISAMQEFGQSSAPVSTMPVALRIGVNSGEVMVQAMQTTAYPEYRAVGETVHLAARMEKLAKPGRAVISQTTLKLVAGHVKAEPIGMLKLALAAAPVQAFQVTRIDLSSRNAPHAPMSGWRPFVGRQEGMTRLREALGKAETGMGTVRVLTGDPGVGKSRLVLEFLATLQSSRFRIVECKLLPAGLAPPLEPLAQLVRQFLGIEDQWNDAEVREAVSASVESWGLTAMYALSSILGLLDVGDDDPTWTGLQPPERLKLAIETVAQIVLEGSQARPLILVLEDYQWAESEIRLFMERLAQQAISSRVLVVVTCRSHFDSEWAAWPNVTELKLSPFLQAESLQFLRSLLGQDPNLDELRDLLIRKAGGNPFFLEECVRGLFDRKVLFGNPGAYRLLHPVTRIEVPATVHATLAARIDTLASADRDVLLSAAVVGQNVDVGLLQDLTGLSRQRLLSHLNRLRHAGFLDRTRIMPNVEFGFRHALIHDVAYATLLKRHRRQLHAKVMAAVKKRRASQLVNKVALIAHHAFQAAIWPPAYVYCRKAGRLAQARSRNREAADFFRSALHVVERLPQTQKNVERSIDLRLEIAQTLLPLGKFKEAHRELAKARRSAVGIQDECRLGRIFSSLMVFHWNNANLASAIRSGKTALRTAREFEDLALEIQVAYRLGSLYVDRGDYALACRLLEDCCQRIPASSARDLFGLLAAPTVVCRSTLARGLGELGRFAEAIRVGDEALRLADEIGHGFSRIHASAFVGHVLLRKGDFERCLPLLESSVALCEATQSKLLLPLCTGSTGYACARMGDVRRGLSLLEEAVAIARNGGLVGHYILQLAWLAEAYLLAGLPDKAAEHALQALAWSLQHGEKGHEAWASWLLGEIQDASGDAFDPGAEAYFRKAQDIAAARQMRPWRLIAITALGNCTGGSGCGIGPDPNSWRQYPVMELLT